MQESQFGDVRPMLFVLMGAVILIVLLASQHHEPSPGAGFGKATEDRSAAGHRRYPLAHDSADADRSMICLSFQIWSDAHRHACVAFCAVSPSPNSQLSRGPSGLNSAHFRPSGSYLHSVGFRCSPSIFDKPKYSHHWRRSR